MRGAGATVTVATPDSVLLVTSRWVRDGGVGAHVQASARALAAYGVHVTVLTGRIEERTFAPEVTVIASAELHDRQAPMRARVGDALACGAEVVHIHQLDDPALVAFIQKQTPTVLSAHAYTACPASLYYFAPGRECARARGPGCIGNMLFRGCLHTRDPRRLHSYAESGRALHALQQADLAISYSHFMDRYLATNAVTRRAVVPYLTTVEPRPGAGESERRRVVFAGRIVKEKGVQTLLRAAQELDAELVICGNGRYLPAMRKLSRELAVAERTHFRGWLSADELARQLAEASVLALLARAARCAPARGLSRGVRLVACGARALISSATVQRRLEQADDDLQRTCNPHLLLGESPSASTKRLARAGVIEQFGEGVGQREGVAWHDPRGVGVEQLLPAPTTLERDQRPPRGERAGQRSLARRGPDGLGVQQRVAPCEHVG